MRLFIADSFENIENLFKFESYANYRNPAVIITWQET